jgi:hypothetical protein
MLDEVGEALIAVRRRKALLVELLNLIDSCDIQEDCDSFNVSTPPDLQPLDTPELIPGNFSTLSDRHPPSVYSQQSECTFTPSISRRSRELAARLPRDPTRLYDRKPAARSAVALIQTKKDEMPAKTNSAVTDAIVDRILKVYGSVEEYRKQRNAKVLHTNEIDVKECTFKPIIEKPRKEFAPRSKPVLIPGLESFVSRQEKARERKLVDKELKPGCGELYTGQKTKLEPFSFSNRVVSRE